jgi:hypothetical protein
MYCWVKVADRGSRGGYINWIVARDRVPVGGSILYTK